MLLLGLKRKPKNGMRLFNINGRLVSKNVSKYLIDWDGKSRSKIQFAVKQFLKKYWEPCICFEEFPVFGSKLKVDLLNATRHIAVEVDGEQHNAFSPFFHGNRLNYVKSIKRDFKKLEWLEKNDFVVINIIEEDIPFLSPEFIKEKFGVEI